MATKPDEWYRSGRESDAFGPGTVGGYVTKVTRLHTYKGTQEPTCAPAQLMTRLRMMDWAKRPSALTKIHLIRPILVNGHPYLLTIHENAHGERQGYDEDFLYRIGGGLSAEFDDIRGRNVIKTKDGFKLIDMFLAEDKKLAQMPEECRKGRCSCNWHDFVRNFPQVGSLPKGYKVPEKLKERFPPEEHPWVGQLERDAGKKPGLR